MSYTITPTNCIRQKKNGKFTVRVRVLGEGSTWLVTDHADSFQEAGNNGRKQING